MHVDIAPRLFWRCIPRTRRWSKTGLMSQNTRWSITNMRGVTLGVVPDIQMEFVALPGSDNGITKRISIISRRSASLRRDEQKVPCQSGEFTTDRDDKRGRHLCPLPPQSGREARVSRTPGRQVRVLVTSVRRWGGTFHHRTINPWNQKAALLQKMTVHAAMFALSG